MVAAHQHKSVEVIGLSKFDEVSAITATREDIEAAVLQGDLPSLLASLAMITGDESLIAEDLRPPTPPMGATVQPQGGMSEAAQAKARKLAAAAIIAYRDNGSPVPDNPDQGLLNRIMGFIIDFHRLV